MGQMELDMKQILDKQIKVLMPLLFLLGLPGSILSAAELVLSAPAESEDGSYVLQLDASGFDGNSNAGELELFRNKDGGDFQRIVSAPLFISVSQLVSQPGVYGYKVRWMSEQRSGEFSEPVYVKVSTRLTKNSEAVASLNAKPNQARQKELEVGFR